MNRQTRTLGTRTLAVALLAALAAAPAMGEPSPTGVPQSFWLKLTPAESPISACKTRKAGKSGCEAAGAG